MSNVCEIFLFSLPFDKANWQRLLFFQVIGNRRAIVSYATCLTSFLFFPHLGLCPDWVEWDPRNQLENTTEAMTLADDHLGVAQVGKRTNSRVQLKAVLSCFWGLHGMLESYVLRIHRFLQFTPRKSFFVISFLFRYIWCIWY